MSNAYIVDTANITVSACKGVTPDGVATYGRNWERGSVCELHPDDAASLLAGKAVIKAAALPAASETSPELAAVERQEADDKAKGEPKSDDAAQVPRVARGR